MSKDLVDLAITMTEMDTGIELSPPRTGKNVIVHIGKDRRY